MTKQRDMKCKKQKLFSLYFQIENLKAKKDQIFLYFLIFKNNDMLCPLD